MIRFFDFLFALAGLTVGLPLILIVFLISFFDTGSPIFFQKRVGLDGKSFTLFKFRTMHVNTVSVASHLASPSAITRFGRLLRQSKLDEVPQLLNVLLGDMSLVGPRPNLFNQSELIKIREAYNVYSVRPGITGLAQIQNIDMSEPELLARTDRQMINAMSIKTYFVYIFKTITGSGLGDVVK